MLLYTLIGAGMIALTVTIHAFGTTAWVRWLARNYIDEAGLWRGRRVVRILLGTALVLVMLHSVQIVLWAVLYRNMGPVGELDTLEAAVYFSFVTFTTLGYGDITLSESWRILSGIEAMNGILLVGWSTAVLFAAVQRSWQGIARPSDRP